MHSLFPLRERAASNSTTVPFKIWVQLQADFLSHQIIVNIVRFRPIQAEIVIVQTISTNKFMIRPNKPPPSLFATGANEPRPLPAVIAGRVFQPYTAAVKLHDAFSFGIVHLIHNPVNWGTPMYLRPHFMDSANVELVHALTPSNRKNLIAKRPKE